MIKFIMGAIAGGLAVWFWRGEIREFFEEKTRGVRVKAADGLQAVEEAAEGVMDRAKSPLDRAGQLLEEGKTQIGTNLRAAQEAIRPKSP